MRWDSWRLCAGLLLVLAVPGQAKEAARPLLTPEEMTRPDVEPPPLRGIFPGPDVVLLSPSVTQLARPVSSPVRIKIAFKPRNNATIAVPDVSLQYLRSPSVDLTPRLGNALTPAGIDLGRLSLPPGRNTLMVSVVDSNGDRRVAAFTLFVRK